MIAEPGSANATGKPELSAITISTKRIMRKKSSMRSRDLGSG